MSFNSYTHTYLLGLLIARKPDAQPNRNGLAHLRCAHPPTAAGSDKVWPLALKIVSLRSGAARSEPALSVLLWIADQIGHTHQALSSDPYGLRGSPLFASLGPAPRSSSPSAIGPGGFAATIKALPSVSLRSTSASGYAASMRLVLPRAAP